jgi:predicted metalloenzyme YecM
MKDTERPGWSIIERYLPNASPEKKEEAYENLRRLAVLIARVHVRQSREKSEKQRALQPPLF